ncbi:MAG TPA: cysteine desulfurase family protein [Thermoleophilia bacterium]|nr:cysteine desulfurase family protein [Thermoleophilia bacterium]
MKAIYFDHAATTPVDPRVLEAMLPFFGERYGNPSELHRQGREARRAVEAARAEVAALVGAGEREIVFTSGGTEADNLALWGPLGAVGTPGRVMVSAVEHAAVGEAARALARRGWAVDVVAVDADGVVDRRAFASTLRSDTRLASVMLANNVVGTLQPIAELARLAHEHGVPFHTDAVQAVGALPVDVGALGVDLLSLSGHKFYGPKGVGALYVRRGTKLAPLLHGGGHERGLRSGTENVPGIVGLGAAARLARAEMAERRPRLEALRDRLIDGALVAVPGVRLLGPRRLRLPGNACLAVSGVESEALVLRLDAAGVMAAGGPACASGAGEPSHVLVALGLSPDEARGSLRLSLGHGSTAEEVDRFLEVFPPIVEELRRAHPRAA